LNGRKAGMSMNRTSTCIAWALAALLACAGQARAEDVESPLAVTAAAAAGVSPTVGDLLRSQGYLQAGLEDLRANAADRAVQDLLDSVRLAPGAANYKALGTAYYQAGNLVKAGWAYRESLKRRPDARVQALAEQLPGAAMAVSPTAAPASGAAAPLTPASRARR
jgi:hypothetical protein